jgi:hypothetical protein
LLKNPPKIVNFPAAKKNPVRRLLKDAVQSVCKQRLCLLAKILNYIFMILEYNKLSRENNQALQEHKMK